MKFFACLFFSLLCFTRIYIAFGQVVSAHTSIKIKTVNEKGEEVQGASISLISNADSSVIKKSISGSDGKLILNAVAAGTYRLLTTCVGYAKNDYGPFTINNSQSSIIIPDIILRKNYNTLKDILVDNKKPLIEHQPGKTIVHVDGSIVHAGSSAYEILQSSPGVSIDQNDNISLHGKQAVVIMIDGKPSQLGGTDLANFLRGLSSNSIDKIELISNPDAKYEAAGSAGIINIKLKKNQAMGANATINLSYGQGVYAKTSEGITLNYRVKRLNIFGSYNYTFRKAYANPVLHREFLSEGKIQSAYQQNDYITIPFHTQLVKIGMDYQASPKTLIGWVFNGYSNHYQPKGDDFSDVLDSNANHQSSFRTTSLSDDKRYNYSVNGNLKHSFDTAGNELNVDIDYARYWNNTNQIFVTDYYKPDGSSLQPSYVLYGELPGDLHIYSIKADYALPLANDRKIELGMKSSYVIADNDIRFFDESNITPVYDSSKSNHFVYKENINAAYVNFSGKYKKITYELGLRAEQTNIKGNQLTLNQQFDTSYIQLFPNINLKYTLSDKHEFSFSASRRIDRPTYRQLDPFKFYIDPTTYISGNPYLRPQETYILELSHTFRQKFTTTIAYNITKDNITDVLYPSPTEEHVTIQSNTNLAKVEYYSILFSFPIQIAKWWNTSNDFSLYYGSYKGSLANTTLNNGNLTFEINSTNSFSLGKGFNAEFIFFYHAPEVYGFYHLHSQWQLTAGIQKNILKNKGSIKLNMADIFHTAVARGNTNFSDYYESFVTKKETCVASISFTYRLGKRTIDAARKRSGGAEQEKNRAATGP